MWPPLRCHYHRTVTFVLSEDEWRRCCSTHDVHMSDLLKASRATFSVLEMERVAFEDVPASPVGWKHTLSWVIETFPRAKNLEVRMDCWLTKSCGDLPSTPDGEPASTAGIGGALDGELTYWGDWYARALWFVRKTSMNIIVKQKLGCTSECTHGEMVSACILIDQSP